MFLCELHDRRAFDWIKEQLLTRVSGLELIECEVCSGAEFIVTKYRFEERRKGTKKWRAKKNE